MIGKTSVIKVPEKMYSVYVKLIGESGKYSETKIKK